LYSIEQNIQHIIFEIQSKIIFFPNILAYTTVPGGKSAKKCYVYLNSNIEKIKI